MFELLEINRSVAIEIKVLHTHKKITHTHTHTHTHTPNPPPHTHAHTHSLTLTHTHTHDITASAQTARTHSLTHRKISSICSAERVRPMIAKACETLREHTHTHTRTHTNTCVYKHMCNTRTHTNTHTHKHTHTHTHTHAHKHNSFSTNCAKSFTHRKHLFNLLGRKGQTHDSKGARELSLVEGPRAILLKLAEDVLELSV